MPNLSNFLVAFIAVSVGLAQQTGEHTEWPRWCGKAYQPEYQSFDPGGQTVEPERLYDPPHLDVRFSPLFVPYEEGDLSGSFIVDALLSPYRGIKWLPHRNHTMSLGHWTEKEEGEEGVEDGEGYFDMFYYTIDLVEPVELGLQTLLLSAGMRVGAEGGLAEFSLTMPEVGLVPRMEPYEVVLKGGKGRSASAVEVTVKSRFWYLPTKQTGSVTIVNHDTGGLWVRKHPTGVSKTLTPYGFYASYDGFLAEDDALAQIDRYVQLGLNAMCPLIRYDEGRTPLEYMEEIGVNVLFDLREIYKNLSAVEEAVILARDADNLFAYWISDEPDGWQDPFNATTEGYKLIKRLDPYHPVAVVPNCQNYHFGPYSSGADIIIPDVYPIGTFSSPISKWGTPCNTTYGDCGCDNCLGRVTDIASRLDDLARYELWLGADIDGGGSGWRKPKMLSPQSFHGEGYWERDPTAKEAWAMSLLGFNHGAQGIISWLWPTSERLAIAHGKLAALVTDGYVSGFFASSRPLKPGVVGSDVDGVPVEGIDAAYWLRGDEGLVLLSVVNTNPEGEAGRVSSLVFNFPRLQLVGGKVREVLWGDTPVEDWVLGEDGHTLVLDSGLEGMATCLLVLELARPGCDDGGCSRDMKFNVQIPAGGF